ncbi:hypothetical protein [Enterobacter hormaechei]|uniref:hypothetical protein n=1 Tax=Enterobacter hormaechei TaxID=158836 RepID=UPI0007B3CF90|nr:hypothetical protein [Enterobacter hormaechei]KZP84534.1 hypothetical protein A3N47_10065 [Enterobacter hormaechei subsp. xiangfangensis]RTM57470.1 hypothetical protein EKO17_23820 [Enterobacter hormaechei subsp. xiangfangensis]
MPIIFIADHHAENRISTKLKKHQPKVDALLLEYLPQEEYTVPISDDDILFVLSQVFVDKPDTTDYNAVLQIAKNTPTYAFDNDDGGAVEVKRHKKQYDDIIEIIEHKGKDKTYLIIVGEGHLEDNINRQTSWISHAKQFQNDGHDVVVL